MKKMLRRTLRKVRSSQSISLAAQLLWVLMHLTKYLTNRRCALWSRDPMAGCGWSPGQLGVRPAPLLVLQLGSLQPHSYNTMTMTWECSFEKCVNLLTLSFMNIRVSPL